MFGLGGEFMQRRYRIRPTFWFFLIVSTVIFFAISFTVAQIRCNQVSSRLAELNQEKAELASEVLTLNQQLAYVQSDAYVERVARDELNMIMPGEIRYVSN